MGKYFKVYLIESEVNFEINSFNCQFSENISILSDVRALVDELSCFIHLYIGERYIACIEY